MNELIMQQSASFTAIIEKAATDKDFDVNKMQQILDMQERVFDKNAKLDFFDSMAQCQTEMPTVIKDSKNDNTESNYAKVETVQTTIKTCYTNHGFSLTFGTDQSPIDGMIRITCDVMHRGGHEKPYYIDLPIDNAGIKGSVNKTQVHGIASTLSYGRRYLLTLIFNVVIADQDNDGNFDPTQWIDAIVKAKTIEEVNDLEVQASQQGILKHLNDTFTRRKNDFNFTPNGDSQAEPIEVVMYPEDKFKENFAIWEKSIADKKNTPESIIKKLELKGQLTDDMKTKIRAIKTT